MVCFPRFPGKPRVKPVDEAWKDCHGQSVGNDEQCQPRQAQTDDGISQYFANAKIQPDDPPFVYIRIPGFSLSMSGSLPAKQDIS